MPIFEHVRDLSWSAEGEGGSSSALVGCQSVSIDGEADEIVHSACDEDAVGYRGITGRKMSGTVELAGVSLARELGAIDLGGVFGHAVSAELTETGDPDIHNADGELWATLIRIRNRSVEAQVQFRDISVALAKAVGEIVTVALTYRLGSTTAGAWPTGGVTVSVPKMVVVSQNITATHNEYADGSYALKATGLIKDVAGGPALSGIHVGNVGTFSWIVPSADGSDPMTFECSNCVITEKRIAFEHGAMLRESFSFLAYSTDGDASPFTGSGG